MSRWTGCGIALALIGCAACTPGIGSLELGTRAGDLPAREFVPLANGDPIPVVFGAGELNMVLPSVRALDAAPGEVEEINVTVSVDGMLIAADIESASIVHAEMADGALTVWDVRVPFQVNSCCYVCSPAILSASLIDAEGREFRGAVNGVLTRNGHCPDATVCCSFANACPDGLTQQLCEP